MDLHVPEGPIRSIKDFLIHIVIVTIGILIALGLEQLVEAHHRHRLAEEAVAGFRRELADDRTAMDEVMASMPKLRTDIDAEILNLESPVPREIHYPGFTYNVISTASWETAVATRALATGTRPSVAPSCAYWHVCVKSRPASCGSASVATCG